MIQWIIWSALVSYFVTRKTQSRSRVIVLCLVNSVVALVFSFLVLALSTPRNAPPPTDAATAETLAMLVGMSLVGALGGTALGVYIARVRRPKQSS